MYQGLVHAHSGLRWILLLMLVVSILTALSNSRKPDGGNSGKLYLFTMIVTHIQLLLGVSLYFMSQKVMFNENTMSNPFTRFYTVEHTVGMLVAIILITLGYRGFKSKSGALKDRRVFVMYFLGLIIILLSIPWPFREQLGAGWF
jgi:hypothetical protein